MASVTSYTKTQLDTLLSGKATPAQITAAVAALTKASVGLSAVDNTSDLNKPVSTATQAAITAAITGLLNGAPGALDTLKELADAINDDASYAATVTAALAARPTTTQVVQVFKPEAYANLTNPATVAGPAIQAAIDAAAAAGGGTVQLSARAYKMGTTTLVIPAAHYYTPGSGVQVDLVGSGIKSTRLQWDSDLGAGKYAISCGDPTAMFANSLGRYASGLTGSFIGIFRDFAVEGPGSSTITSTTLGAISTQMSGIAWGARRSMKNVNIRGFYAGLDIVGDNATFENVSAGDCYYTAYWNQQSTYYYGDLVFTKCLFGHGTMAAIGLHPLSQGIKGTRFDGCYFSGSPYGIFLESDSVTTFPYLTGDVIFDNCMFEGIGNAMFYDDNSTVGSAGGGVAKGILGGLVWRNSLFGWQDNQLLTTGGRDRKAMIIAGQMATCLFEGIRNAQQWIPGSVALWDGGQYKGVRIVANMDNVFTAVAGSGKPFIKSPGGGGFSANTIEFESPGYYKGTFLPQVNGGAAVAVGNLVERNGNRFDRADAASTGPVFGIALTATTGGTSQAMTAVATSGEQIPITLTGSGLAAGYLKKGSNGLAAAASGPTDGQIVGWLKSSSGSTGTAAFIRGGGSGATGAAGQGFTYRGAWAASTAYNLYDVVTNAGSTYVVITAHTSGATFTTANLNLWASVGATGYGVAAETALHGLVGLSASPANASGTYTPAAGRTNYVKVPATGGSTITGIVLDIATAGVGTTAYVGVYSAAGTLLAQSADFGAATTTVANTTVALTTSANVPSADSYVYVGLLVATASTVPVFRGAANGISGTAANFALTGSQGLRAFYTNASGQSTLPATVTVASGTSTGAVYLLGLAGTAPSSSGSPSSIVDNGDGTLTSA